MPKQIVESEFIDNKIFFIRGQKVMLDRDLAMLYRVETKVLIQAVKRNIERFPEDFMFQLTWEEVNSSRSQIVTLKHGHNIKYLPYAFTEQGVAMLSGVLHSKRAIEVNIAIMRAFVRIKQVLSTHKELAEKLRELEKEVGRNSKLIIEIFEIIKKLTQSPMPPPKRQIGFHS
ncbi:MAG: ORF6N domain-containing protein [Candidatus Omnitrophota bacterium]